MMIARRFGMDPRADGRRGESIDRLSSLVGDQACAKPRSIQVYFDYVCPFCFLAEQVLQDVALGRDIELEWMPFELRPEPRSTPENAYLQGTWNRSVRPLAREIGVPIQMPAITPQPRSRLAFEARPARINRQSAGVARLSAM